MATTESATWVFTGSVVLLFGGLFAVLQAGVAEHPGAAGHQRAGRRHPGAGMTETDFPETAAY